MAFMERHLATRRALYIFGACGLTGVLLDLDHIPIMFNPNWSAGTSLIRPEPHYWILMGAFIVVCLALSFACGLSAWMVLDAKRKAMS
jgi:hypothetical protein